MKVGFIGSGNMGGALARAASRAEGANEIYLADFFPEKAEALAKELGARAGDNAFLLETCDLVFLGVKPQILPSLMEEIRELVGKRGKALTLCSMAAGVSLATLEEGLGKEVNLIRIMPNTPVSVGEGVIVYCHNGVEDGVLKSFEALLSKAGLVEPIEENKIDAASALHGCGPAFAYLFIEALADGAVNCGLPRDKALAFASKTVKGAAEMVLQTGLHPGALKDAVCSPGGTTIEGVRVLEDKGLRAAAMDAVVAAYEKTLALGKK